MTNLTIKSKLAHLTTSASIAALVAALALPFLSSTAQAQSLSDELAVLLSTSPSIAAASDKAIARHHDVQAESAAYLPDLRLSGDIGREQVDRSRQDAGTKSTLNRRKIELRSSYTVYDGDERLNRVAGADARSDLAGLTGLQTKQIVLFEGISAYLDVMRLDHILKLSRQNEKTVREQLELEDERVEGGVGVAVDVLFAKARLQKAKEDRTALEGELGNAIARYAQIFGHTPAIDNLKKPAPLKDVLPKTLQDAVDMAWEENLNLAASRAAEYAALHDRNVADSQNAPKLALVGAASRENDTLGDTGRRQDLSVRAQLNWSLFDGYATRNRTKAADYDYAAARHETIQQQREVEEDVRTSFNNLDTANQRVALLENASELSTAVHDARVKQRKAGQTTALTVLDAERERFDTEIALQNARTAAQVAQYRLLLAIGRLNAETLGINGPAPDSAELATTDGDMMAPPPGE